MKPAGKRATARLAAVQALYQIEFRAATPAAVIEEFTLHRFAAPGANEAMVPETPDHALFADIVTGARARGEDIDAFITPVLAAGWALKRLDPVLRAILRAGTYELLARPDVPAKVAITEYVDVARRFFDAAECGMANAVLDKIARRLRPTEFAVVGTADGAG